MFALRILTQRNAEFQTLDLQRHVDQALRIALDEMVVAKVFTSQREIGSVTFLVYHQLVAQHMTYQTEAMFGVIVIDVTVNLVLVNVLGQQVKPPVSVIMPQ